MDIEKDHPGIVGRNGIHCSSESDEGRKDLGPGLRSFYPVPDADTEEASETDVGRGDGERCVLSKWRGEMSIHSAAPTCH